MGSQSLHSSVTATDNISSECEWPCESSNSQELELQAAISYCMCSVNRTPLLWKTTSALNYWIISIGTLFYFIDLAWLELFAYWPKFLIFFTSHFLFPVTSILLFDAMNLRIFWMSHKWNHVLVFLSLTYWI